MEEVVRKQPCVEGHEGAVGEPGIPEEPAPSTSADEFQVSLPWRVVEGDEFFTVHDPVLKEVCRIPKTVPDAAYVAQVFAATPWLLMAVNRTLTDLNGGADRKDGTTLRQWAKNYDGFKRREELAHALAVALDPKAADTPPSSYGLILKRPTGALPKKSEKSFREMLNS